MPVTLANWTEHKRRQRNPLWPSAQVFWNDLTIFILGSSGAFSINFIGSMPGNEVLLFPLFPILIAQHGKRAFRREYLWFYILLAGWLFGTIGGDLYLGTPVDNKLKGIARVVFLGLDFAALAILIDKKTRGMIVFALTFPVAMLLGALNFRADFLTFWKMGLSYSLTVVVLLISSYFYARRRYAVCIFLSTALAALNLIFAFRSQMAVNLIAGALVLPIFARRSGKASGAPLEGKEVFQVILILVLAGGAAWVGNRAVLYAANQNWFDEDIAAKFEMQSAGKLGVLVGGRPETLVAIQAIIDSPIIGHGSFAVDPKYLQIMQDIQYKYDYSSSDVTEESDEDVAIIPTHSHLTMAWVESGILGGIFWIYILALTIWGILRLVLLRPPMAPIYAFFLVGFTWDIFFSPLGGVNRIWAIYFILISYGLMSAKPAKPAHRPIYQSPKTRLSGSFR